MPSIRTVAIINPHTEQTLQLQSLSGSTVHFHASFFQSKVSGDADTNCLYLGPKQRLKCAGAEISSVIERMRHITNALFFNEMQWA